MAFNAESAPRVTVTFPSGMSADALDGRLILIFAPGGEQEPRLQVSWDQDAIPFFAMDVARWTPGKKQTFDGRSAGFPIATIDELPAGDYRVQAVLNRYERFTLADGRSLLLAPDRGVYGVEEFLKGANPPADAVVDYGDRAEHCWNGDHTRANAYSRLRYPQMVLPWVVDRILDTAPQGADVDSWRY